MAKIEAMLEEAKAELARHQRRLQDYYYYNEEKQKLMAKHTETADVEKKEKCKGEQ